MIPSRWLDRCLRGFLALNVAGNIFKLESGIADLENAIAAEECVALGDNVNLVSIAEIGAARGAVGHGAVAVELHVGRKLGLGRRRRRRRHVVAIAWFRSGSHWRWGRHRAERIAT